MKKLLILLALCLCLAIFVGCKQDEEIPRGYKNATCASETFRFYIPTAWNATTSYGISGGYCYSTTSIVRLNKYERAEGEDADAFYTAYLRPAFLALSQDLYEADAPVSAVLGELDARRYHERGSVSGEKLHFLTYVGTSKNAFYVLTFTADDSVFDSLLSSVEGMAEVFQVAEPYTADKPVRLPSEKADVPAGMRIVSSDDVAYRFFVPESWEFDESISICEAHNKANTAVLSVVPYQPKESMTVSEFLDIQNGQLITAYGESYEKLYESEGDAKLGGRSASVVEYRITQDGKAYHVYELATAYRGMIYSLTYTATEESYLACFGDAGQAIAAFTFR